MIYLDNSATTQVDQDVAGTACEVMTEVYGNPSSPYLLGRDALGRLTAARQQVAQVIGAPTRQIFFTSGGTEANNLAIRGSVLAARKEGRLRGRIITTAIEHSSVLESCRSLEEEGYEVVFIRPRDGRIQADDVIGAVNQDTLLVSVMAVNNETGERLPVEEMFAGVKQKNPDVLVHCDCVQGFVENKVTADYLDEEGCLHCGTCGKRKQMKVSLMGFEHVVSCLCECEVKARQELDEKMQREEEQRQLYQRKSVGLRERRFWEWKFENDNGSNQKILIARQYVENWTDMKRKNVGLLLMGPVGTGKSFFAGCIANALLEQGERVMMTNFSRILNEMTSYQADKNQIIQNLVDYPLLIIDDLGIERNSEFALEQVYNVIDSRYCKMLPLIVTTNLGLNEMKSTDLDTAHQRIYSRILEMCVPIYCGGEDKRKEEGTEKLVQVQNLIIG